MGNFNRGNFNRNDRSGGGRDFNRRDFGGRPSMHQAVCSRCGNECEVPFKPTNGKPVFCNNCFQSNAPSDSRRPEGRNSRFSSEDRQLFDAVCANCGKNCKIPFEPRTGKPVYCNDCFGEKGSNESRPTVNTDQYKKQFEAINAKLDKILKLIAPNNSEQSEELVEAVNIEDKKKSAKPAKKSKAPKNATPLEQV